MLTKAFINTWQSPGVVSALGDPVVILPATRQIYDHDHYAGLPAVWSTFRSQGPPSLFKVELRMRGGDLHIHGACISDVSLTRLKSHQYMGWIREQHGLGIHARVERCCVHDPDMETGLSSGLRTFLLNRTFTYGCQWFGIYSWKVTNEFMLS